MAVEDFMRAVEDLTTYEEVPARRWTLNTDLTLTNLEEMGRVITEPIRITRPYRFMDSLKREISELDILVWMGGGMYYKVYHYGIVLHLNDEQRTMKLRNTNDNKITIWNSYNTLILAKYPNYENVPESLLNQLGIEDF